MKLLEAREGFVKIQAEKDVVLSSFIQIGNFEKLYIAQVLKVQKASSIYFVYAKLLYLFNGTFESYDGSIPYLDSEVKIFESENLLRTFIFNEPIKIGKFIENREDIVIDKSCFDKNTIISLDNSGVVDVLVSNLKQELSKYSKTVVIDMQGVMTGPKFLAGKDFRLPLNTESLDFIYQDCLSDATLDSKNLIKDIFKDLSEYSKTVKFLPFGALKNIVDDMVDNSHVFKLLVLKNKLSNFDRMGYFAVNHNEAENLNKILLLKSAVIDLSKLDVIFQNRYLETIYKNLEKGTQVVVIASNSITKKNLKTVLTKQSIASTFVTHSKFKYLNEIKSMFKNFVIEPSFSNNEVFKQYAAFLNVMLQNTILIVGEGTNYLPIISLLERYPEEPNMEVKSINEVFEYKEANTISDGVEEINAKLDLDEENNEQILAINKKSEKLIEKISADLESAEQTDLSLFEDDKEIEEKEFNAESEESQEKETTFSQNDDRVFESEIVLEDNLEKENEQEALNESLEIENVENVDNSGKNVNLDENSEKDILLQCEKNEDFHTEIDEYQTIEVSDEILEMTDEVEEDLLSDEIDLASDIQVVEQINELENIEDDLGVVLESSIEKENVVYEENKADDNDVLIESNELLDKAEEVSQNLTELLDEKNDETVLEEDLTDNVNDVIELDPSEVDENDIIIDLNDVDELDTDENLEKEIIEDVDKVFTTLKEETLSDNDLDLIDELNSESVTEESFEEIQNSIETQEELDFTEPIEELNENSSFEEEEKEILETKKSTTLNVPVYDAEIPAEDTVLSDPIEQGDTVNHAKYGVGVVEKMIKYGNKTLFSINFDNVGRRLLDPTLTEIKKS